MFVSIISVIIHVMLAAKLLCLICVQGRSGQSCYVVTVATSGAVVLEVLQFF